MEPPVFNNTTPQDDTTDVAFYSSHHGDGVQWRGGWVSDLVECGRRTMASAVGLLTRSPAVGTETWWCHRFPEGCVHRV